ncbi:hypothetical protein [Streptosporangium sp. CA-115845]|uniref:hypothetical protein n=1 Tax=Streptosporangium sp. CA-115845 TaxID=3240071 RepID=UPI003D8BB35F
MGQLPAQAAQAVLKTYRQAWVNFLNPGHPARRPTFKSRSRSRMAVDVPQAQHLNTIRLNRRWGLVNLPKAGRGRFRWTKDLPGVTKGGPAGRITGARLVREPDGWHLVFRTEPLVEPAAAHRGPQVGIDRGITVALALSDGTNREHRPWLTSGQKEHLRRLERKSARQRRIRPRAGRRPSDWPVPTTRSPGSVRQPSAEPSTGSTRPPPNSPPPSA